MDYAALPPEINSLRMYSGPGAQSLTAAAAAWSRLSSELTSASTSYQWVISELQSGNWTGPSATVMAQAVTPFVQWLQSTAVAAEASASKANQAAVAYQVALAATVPPPVIAQNRAMLATLVATNIAGQHTAAIAANEAQYSQMWAQDAQAMYQYASASSAAATLPSYAQPPATTNPGAASAQSHAVTQAVSTAAGNGQSQISQLLSQMTNALHSLSSPASSSSGSSIWDLLQRFASWWAPIGGDTYSTVGLPFFGAGIASFFAGIAKSAGVIGVDAPAAAIPAAALPSAVMPAAALASASGVSGGAPISASLANASTVGKLAVPASWTGSTPVTAASSGPEFVSEVIEPESSLPTGSLIGGIPAAGSGAARNYSGATPRYGVRPTVVTRPPSAG